MNLNLNQGGNPSSSASSAHHSFLWSENPNTGGHEGLKTPRTLPDVQRCWSPSAKHQTGEILLGISVNVAAWCGWSWYWCGWSWYWCGWLQTVDLNRGLNISVHVFSPVSWQPGSLCSSFSRLFCWLRFVSVFSEVTLLRWWIFPE